MRSVILVNMKKNEIILKINEEATQEQIIEALQKKLPVLKKLYKEKTGKDSNVHKYHVLRWDKPSTTIPAHLKKDGLRHIHPDPEQKRSITVREAARIQTFDDDFLFNESMGKSFEMIGNAVPPYFAKKLGDAIYYLYNECY